MSTATPGSRGHGPLHRQLCWFVQLRWVAVAALAAGALLEWRTGLFGGSAARFAAVGLIVSCYNFAIARLVLDRCHGRPGAPSRAADDARGAGCWALEAIRDGDAAGGRRKRPHRRRARRGNAGVDASRAAARLGPAGGQGRHESSRVRDHRLLSWVAFAQLLLDLVALTALVLWTGGTHSPLIAFFVFHMVFASLLLPRYAAYASAAAAGGLLAGGLWLAGQFPAARADGLFLLGIVMTLGLTVMLTNRITRDLRAHRRQLLRQNRRVKAMSRQLREHQQALVQHEKMVAMGRMAAGVTHEIANPLACMDSLLQLAQRRPERVNGETVEKLREQVQRINQIIQQMKAFAHPTEVVTQAMPLNEVVEQALAMVRFDARLKKTDVRREFDPHAGVVSMSPQALQQVLINLIINALDAMSATDKPVLTVRTQRRDGWCAVDVIDNGHGIDPQHLPRLFEPFFTTKPVGKGTGLGLSISYSLMQQQGGSISVRSHRDEGATFTLRLPTTGAAPRGSRVRESAVAGIGGRENSTP